jgi:hypothetical protein
LLDHEVTSDELLQAAREKFLNRDLAVRREALEKLWDAWERRKSLSEPADKRRSVELLLNRASAESNLRDRIEVEARQLTEIGNNFMIRHTEATKTPITESIRVDYLFHRLFLSRSAPSGDLLGVLLGVLLMLSSTIG